MSKWPLFSRAPRGRLTTSSCTSFAISLFQPGRSAATRLIFDSQRAGLLRTSKNSEAEKRARITAGARSSWSLSGTVPKEKRRSFFAIGFLLMRRSLGCAAVPLMIRAAVPRTPA